jgi:dihydrolipoamide dehydrogenase
MYDVAIIGSGPGGYVAAIRAAQLGAKVCVVEKNRLGGVCLNRGCIPTKVLISCVDTLLRVRDASHFGIEVGGYEVDFPRMILRKDEVVSHLRRGIESLFKARKIEFIQGIARLISSNEIEVSKLEVGNQKLEAKNIIIATGSSPLELPNLRFDGKKFLSSDQILNISETPKSLLIIGGGVIGCEFATIFASLGTKVTIVEMMEQILPQEDKEVAKKLELIFKKRGIEVLTKTKIDKVEEIKQEKTLVCVGRSPNTTDLGLEQAGIKLDKGRIAVNEYLQTNLPGIFAIGDCIGGYLLAHVASYEGVVAAENIFGKLRKVDYRVVPNCIFTNPEIGSVGLTKQKAGTRPAATASPGAGTSPAATIHSVAAPLVGAFKAVRFPFSASGKAAVLGETDGFVKIIADSQTDEILGASIIGPQATELIAETAIAMKLKAKASEISEIIFAHPTLSESIHEAFDALYERAIHLL